MGSSRPFNDFLRKRVMAEFINSGGFHAPFHLDIKRPFARGPGRCGRSQSGSKKIKEQKD